MTDATEAECVVCGAEAGHVRVGEHRLCDDPRCADVAKRWATMSPDGDKLTFWEAEAVKAGGKAAGNFAFDECGTTDLMRLSPDQYGEFCRRFVHTYRETLREQWRTGAPPF